MSTRTTLKTHHEIRLIFQRMACEIAEAFSDETDLYFVALNTRGMAIALELNHELNRLLPNCAVSLGNIHVADDYKWEGVVPNMVALTTPVIIVDDVIHSGGTAMQVLVDLYEHGFDTIRTAFLAEREHRDYPIKANFVGVSIATTLQEHVYFSNEDPSGLQLYLI
jgi:pyrimidine operon attenuation protein/uracil phosphoribosyltransferase